MTMFKNVNRLAIAAALSTGAWGMASANSADPHVEQAMYGQSRVQSDIQARIDEARESVDGAKADMSDAKTQLAALERGDFKDIVIVSEGEVSKCGQPNAYPGCKPLTDADKRDAKLEAQKTLDGAREELASAEADLEQIQKVKSADAR